MPLTEPTMPLTLKGASMLAEKLTPARARMQPAVTSVILCMASRTHDAGDDKHGWAHHRGDE
jgi:hypothetical protein